jgi:hypothetical protein
MKGIGLKEMIIALRKELLDAQKEGVQRDLKFNVEQIEMEVELVTTKEGGAEGGVKFWVYSADMKASLGETRTHRLKLKLKPESNDGDLSISDDGTK